MQKKDTIVKAIRSSTIHHAQNAGRPCHTVTREYDLVHAVANIETLVSTIRFSSDKLFTIRNHRERRGTYLDRNALGNLFLTSALTDFQEIKIHFPHHLTHPYYELFANLVKEHDLKDLLRWVDSKSYDDKRNIWCDILNNCVDEIRKVSNSAAFIVDLQDYLRSINKNSRSLLKYLNALSNTHPRMYGIRLDLSYEHIEDWPFSINKEPTIPADIKTHWSTLLKFMKTELPNSCLCGFTWKLEHSLDRSLNYHLFVLIDATAVDYNNNIAQLIGEHWKKTAERKNGRYYNYNYLFDFKSAGIGMINRENYYNKKLLEDVIIYMTKTEYFIKLKLPGTYRSFGKGNMPKKLAHPST